MSNDRAPAGESALPHIVQHVLRQPGAPLDRRTRDFFEPRFGTDLSHIRLHTDAQAAASARAVNASAYTVGRDVVLGARQYAPDTPAGQHLLAHELAHVAQQRHRHVSLDGAFQMSEPSDLSERAADRLADGVVAHRGPGDEGRPPRPIGDAPVLHRRVSARHTNCPADTNGAPADPIAALEAMDATAQGLSLATGTLLISAGILTEAGFRSPESIVDLAFQDTFGLPVAVPGGFLNRLTGVVRPTFEKALGEEMQLMGLRYQLLARFFSEPVAYRCGLPDTFDGCSLTAAFCAAQDAGACEGVSALFLCPRFWGFNEQEQAGTAIHETAHAIWGSVVHGARGSGGNFRHAECYAELVALIFAFDMPGTTNPCVPPGP